MIRKGFGGVTHLFGSLCIMMLFILIPLPFLGNIFPQMRYDGLLFFVSMIVLGGGALLPDLDNSESSAGYSLGVIGAFVKSFMMSTAYIVWEFYHGKNDKRPPTAHRLLWHAPIVGISFILIFQFLLQGSNDTLLGLILSAHNGDGIFRFIISNPVIVFAMFMIFIATLSGSNLIFYYPKKMLKGIVPKNVLDFIDFALPIIVLLFAFTTTMHDFKILALSVAIGYLLHIIEDLFSQGSIPIIWPIPAFWLGKVWWKPWVPGAIRTGGIINTIMNYVLEIMFVILLIATFS